MSDQTHFSAEEFQDFRDFLQDAAGIDLGLNKQYLVATRVRRILIDHTIANLAELTQKIRSGAEHALRQKVIDAMTTNETFWFRDIYPYEYLANAYLEELQQRGVKRPRVWSAACSYGQEPYSIAMVIEEYVRRKAKLSDYPCEILATDLSSTVLDAAAKGSFDRLSVTRGLEGDRLKAFFHQQGPDTWCVNDKLKSRITFRAQNLLESYLLLGKFDAIFCRNVLIYFSATHKLDIIRRLHRSLNPNGILVLGSSESLGEAHELFIAEHVRPGVIYRAR